MITEAIVDEKRSVWREAQKKASKAENEWRLALAEFNRQALDEMGIKELETICLFNRWRASPPERGIVQVTDHGSVLFHPVTKAGKMSRNRNAITVSERSKLTVEVAQ